MNKALGTTGIALAALAAAACTKTEPAPAVGMANPASVYCESEKIGGKLRIEKTPQGEQGICVLPNGTEVEEWTLFRRDHPEQGRK